MKIALVALKSTMLTDAMMHAPLGLFYLASRLQSLGHDVDFYDLNEDKYPEDVYDQMWVSSTSPQISQARLFSNLTKYYKSKRVLGGPLVWEYPPSAYDLGYDLIVSGEADEPNNCQLVLDTDGDELDNKHLLLPVSRKLDWILPPERKWSKRYKSMIYTPDGKEYVASSAFGSRGCPEQCQFCTSGRGGVIWDKFSRFEPLWSIEQQMKEIRDLGFDAIYWYDDILPLAKPRTLEIMKLHKKYGLVWRCFLRTDIINKQGGKEYLEQMKDGGLVEIFVGVESADNQIKKNILKGTTIEQDTNVLNWCKELGIVMKCSFILGLPGESMESMEKTRMWILENRPHRTQIDKLIPFPGTPLTRNPERFDLKYESMPAEDWFYKGRDDLESHNFVSTSHLSKEEIDDFWHKLNVEIKEVGLSH